MFSLFRYGWFYIHEPRSFGIPYSPIPYELDVQSGGTEAGCNANLETLYDERDKVEVISKECKAIDVADAANEVVAQRVDNASVAPLVNCLDALLCVTYRIMWRFWDILCGC